MKSDLYCIKCQKMVRAEMDFAGRWFHENTARINNSPDPGDRFDLVVCEMPDGVAACPPPPFDLDGYIAENNDEAYEHVEKTNVRDNRKCDNCGGFTGNHHFSCPIYP